MGWSLGNIASNWNAKEEPKKDAPPEPSTWSKIKDGAAGAWKWTKETAAPAVENGAFYVASWTPVGWAFAAGGAEWAQTRLKNTADFAVHTVTNPGRSAALLTQGAINGVTSTVGVVTDFGRSIIYDWTTRNAENWIRSAYNLGADKDSKLAKIELGDFARTTTWLNENIQVRNIPGLQDSKYWKRIDPADAHANYERVLQYGTQALVEIPAMIITTGATGGAAGALWATARGSTLVTKVAGATARTASIATETGATTGATAAEIAAQQALKNAARTAPQTVAEPALTVAEVGTQSGKAANTAARTGGTPPPAPTPAPPPVVGTPAPPVTPAPAPPPAPLPTPEAQYAELMQKMGVGGGKPPPQPTPPVSGGPAPPVTPTPTPPPVSPPVAPPPAPPPVATTTAGAESTATTTERTARTVVDAHNEHYAKKLAEAQRKRDEAQAIIQREQQAGERANGTVLAQAEQRLARAERDIARIERHAARPPTFLGREMTGVTGDAGLTLGGRITNGLQIGYGRIGGALDFRRDGRIGQTIEVAGVGASFGFGVYADVESGKQEIKGEHALFADAQTGGQTADEAAAALDAKFDGPAADPAAASDEMRSLMAQFNSDSVPPPLAPDAPPAVTGDEMQRLMALFNDPAASPTADAAPQGDAYTGGAHTAAFNDRVQARTPPTPEPVTTADASTSGGSRPGAQKTPSVPVT